MPFTLSHSAAVLPMFPFLRHRFWGLALVVGACAPDLGYYLRWFGVATFAHSWAGNLWVNVPAGVLVLGGLLWLRGALLFLLPSPLRALLAPALVLPQGSWGRRLCLAGGMVWIGAATHIFWDAFTHQSGWAVHRWPMLQEAVVLPGGSLPLHSLLQQISSLLGGAVVLGALGGFLWRLPRRWVPGDGWRWGSWMALGVVALIFGSAMAWGVANPLEGGLPLRRWVFQCAVYSGAFFGGASLVLLISTKIALRRGASGHRAESGEA